ncbi:hypothetical protein U9R90_20270 [Streptomyces sp. E11-3]|uniref:hypothetical protein n=1 Tax=Streptomyces sp. E11-3 TaxID=3110112 RepID=UPI0039819256
MLDQLPEPGSLSPDADERAYEELVARLRRHWAEADARCEELRRELGAAEDFANYLDDLAPNIMIVRLRGDDTSPYGMLRP